MQLAMSLMLFSIYLQQSTAFILLEEYIFGEKLLQNLLKEVLQKRGNK